MVGPSDELDALRELLRRHVAHDLAHLAHAHICWCRDRCRAGRNVNRRVKIKLRFQGGKVYWYLTGQALLCRNNACTASMA